MIGHFLQKLHQGVDPAHSMMNKGGGGGSSTPYYASQDRLFGTQADIAQNLYNQYANLAPNYLSNTSMMVDEAMSGETASKMRQQAGNDAVAANGASWGAMNRNMSRMGANFSTDRMLSEANRNSIMGAANTTGALNNATRAAEEAKWNMNAGAYGQIAGMGTGAMQGLGSAGSGYGNMAAVAGRNDAMNSAGWGKFGANIAGGMFAADGGYIDGAQHYAYGGPVSPYKNYLTPVNYQARSVDPYQGSSGINPLVALGGLGLAAMYKDELKGLGKDVKGGLRELPGKIKGEYYAATAPAASEFTVPQYDDGPSAGEFTVPQYDVGPSNDYYEYDLANGGYIAKRGLCMAGGGYAQPISGDYETDPYRFRQEGSNPYVDAAGNMAAKEGLRYGIKSAFNSPSDASLVSSAAETPGVAAASPVVDTGAGIVSSALPEAAAAPVADTGAGIVSSALPEAAATGAEAAGLGAAGATAAATGAEAAGLGVAGAEAASLAAAATGAEAAAGITAAELLPLLLLNKGGNVQGRGLRKNMKPGGKVAGPGTETSDDIPAWLSDGEYVLNAEAVKLIGREKLDALNQRGLKLRGKKAPPAKGKGVKLAKGGTPAKKC